MTDMANELDALRIRLTKLENQIETLSGELARAVELIDRYGATLGGHLKGLASDQRTIVWRVANIERALASSS
jgi:hypothetical protein